MRHLRSLWSVETPADPVGAENPIQAIDEAVARTRTRAYPCGNGCRLHI